MASRETIVARAMGSSAAPLEARDVVKSFGGRPALDGATLSLAAGEILGLLGPNGAGKTTLVRSIVGRVRPDSGSLRVFGLSPTDAQASAARGWVPQEIALYPLLSPRENLYSFGRYQGLAERDLAAAAARSLEWAALTERANERTERLSGGMRRRLNMAAGTIHRPRLLLLDEPTVGVDPQSRERIYAMIEELRHDGVSILYTTHYMEEAERLCDRIAIIDHGKVIATGTKDALVRKTLGKRRTLVVDAEEALPETLRGELAARGAALQADGARIPVEEPAREIPEVLDLFRRAGAAVRDLTLQPATLESVFLKLTGRELRE
ncbi:MAG TPA: ABC transporter ATP-binding protein [Thermoanaerobaculia bacterium]|nr:ABC transporter ATP-binding protein [Thermoanaerobaculia bacterium]